MGELVADNFRRFGLYDNQVKFLKGFFSDTLPKAKDHGLTQIALLRVDGDLYSSTMDVLTNLYDKVAPGGYIIFDDYPLPQSAEAIHDFFKMKQLEPHLLQFDRMTPEKDNENGTDHINMQAYFQKP